MTTPPQGPWGPGQPGGQPGGQHGGQGGQPPQNQPQNQPQQQPPQQGGWGQQPPSQGGWGQRPQQPPQQGQPQQGQPQQGQPQQGQQPPQQGGWGQRPQAGQPGQGQPPQQGQQPPQQSGWGQRSTQQQGGPYQQQSWGQQPGQSQGGWHQQQGGQPGGPGWQQGGSGGGSKGPGGISKDKMPLVIGGGVVGIVLIGLLVFLGIHAFGGKDEPESGPTNSQPSGNPSEGGGDNGELGNATGQAKTATEKLQGIGYGCSDLFNTSQGAQRGCFKYDGATEAETVFQFQPDGTIIGVRLISRNQDNVNNAKVTFDAQLQALGNDTIGGDPVKKVQDAVSNGQKDQKVGTEWGEFQLSNDGDLVELTGRKSGADSYDLPKKTFQTTQAQLVSVLKAKKYVCTASCLKTVGRSGQQRVYTYGSQGEGLKVVDMSGSGDPADVKNTLAAAMSDVFANLKGPDVGALQAYIKAHSDGKSYASYVAGWRVEITVNGSDSYASQEVNITYESFYV